MKDIRIYKEVNENWYPCYKIDDGGECKDLVRVSLMYSCMTQINPFLRVCVWGVDDLGMEKDWPPTSENITEAEEMFFFLVTEEITFDKLFKLGFVRS